MTEREEELQTRVADLERQKDEVDKQWRDTIEKGLADTRTSFGEVKGSIIVLSATVTNLSTTVGTLSASVAKLPCSERMVVTQKHEDRIVAVETQAETAKWWSRSAVITALGAAATAIATKILK